MREAEVSVTDGDLAAMGVEKLLSITRSAGLVSVDELVCRGTGAVIQVDVEKQLDETRLDDLDCVNEWRHVGEQSESHRYIISFTAPELPEGLADTADDLLGTCDPDLNDRRATLSLVGPQQAIAGQLSEYEQAGVSPDLERIGGYKGADGTLDSLTNRQRDVIETAWELGYYEVPKEATTADIAAELDLDPSTVTEHLQRAERNLFSELL